MNILVICHEFPPQHGGGGSNAFFVAKELSNRHDVDVITPFCKGLRKFETIGKVRIHRVPVIGRVGVETKVKPPSLLPFVSFVVSGILAGLFFATRKKYSIIHSHFVVPSGLIGNAISLFAHVPHVTTVVDADIFDARQPRCPPYNNVFLRFAIAVQMKLARRIVCISHYVKDAAQRYCFIEGKTTVIPCGIGIVNSAPVSRKELHLDTNDFILVSIGRLVKRKGFEYLLEVLKFVSIERARLLIIGSGPELHPLEEKAKELGLSDKVDFLGAVRDDLKYRYLAVSDLFVLHSLHEGFGICFLEALVFGLPIVATDEGGQKDIVTNGENGYLVPAGDCSGFAEKINALFRNKSLYAAMKGSNMVKAREFSISVIAQRYENVFREAMRQ